MTVTAPTPTTPAIGRRATFGHAVRSEWTKLRSLRSTGYSLVAFVCSLIGLSVAIAYGFGGDYHDLSPAEQADFVPSEVPVLALQFAWLAIMVLGVLTVTGEYATGTIRASLAAVPQRPRLLAAKAVVFAAVTLVVGTVTGVLAFLVSQEVLASLDVPHTSFSASGVPRAALGIGPFLTLIGLLSIAVGAILRATAGAIAAMVLGVIILPSMAGLLPESWADVVQRFWPTNAGFQLLAVQPDPDLLGPWAGGGVLAGFVAGMFTLAMVVLHRRDA